MHERVGFCLRSLVQNTCARVDAPCACEVHGKGKIERACGFVRVRAAMAVLASSIASFSRMATWSSMRATWAEGKGVAECPGLEAFVRDLLFFGMAKTARYVDTLRPSFCANGRQSAVGRPARQSSRSRSALIFDLEPALAVTVLVRASRRLPPSESLPRVHAVGW